MNVVAMLWFLVAAEGKRLSSEKSPSLYKSVNQRVNRGQEFGGGVDFGHVYRDEYKEAKKQADLDSDINEPFAKELKHYSREPQWTMKPDFLRFLSPRDEILYNDKFRNTDNIGFKGKNSNDTNLRLSRPMWYDFPKLLERNIANPFANRQSKLPQTKVTNRRGNSSSHLQDNAFYLKPNRNSRTLNWTTCDEFARRAVFHPDDVVNANWLPFYIWSARGFTTSAIHTFSYPTKKIVQYYKTNFKPYIKNLNWYEPKLLLKERREILLIAGDRRGLFFGIPKQELPSRNDGLNITLPILTLRMKIHDPYLALMYCDERYAAIMAEMGTGPESDRDKTFEASTLKFKGIGIPSRRDVEGERLERELEKKRKIEQEARKFINVKRPIGDVDFNVKH